MAIITYHCKKCKKDTIRIENLDNPINEYECMHCQKIAELKSYVPSFRQTKKRETNIGGTTHFEPAFGMEINTKDIDKLCKQHGMVYGGDDLTAEAKRNKAYNEARFKNEFNSGLDREMRAAGL